MENKSIDNVNHPSHYCQEGSMECIDEMIMLFGKEEVMHFCKLNAWKYRKRALYKNKEEDMKKSDWYLAKYKELKESSTFYNISPTSSSIALYKDNSPIWS